MEIDWIIFSIGCISTLLKTSSLHLYIRKIMQRRPFIKLLGSSLSSLPFLPVIEDSFSTQTQWQQWLKQLIDACGIAPFHSLSYSGSLPPVPAAVQSGEFTKTGPHTYFYEQRHYCFQVFEKKHPSAGVLDLLIPFWTRNTEGGWSKVVCLSMYDLKTLAEATSKFSTDSAGYLLPLQEARPNQYRSAKGQVELISYLKTDGTVSTNLRVMKDAEVIGESGSFFS
jgi:hypothetical protein